MAIEDLMVGGQLLRITRWGEPVMHAETKRVTEFDDDLRALVADMFATMRAAHGVGLAATQVGRDLSLFVYQCPDADDKIRHGAICNPVVTTPTGKDRRLESSEEGCLSYPGGYQQLARSESATCTGQDPWGDEVTVHGTGLLARCLQHETDHLNGIVFGDRLSTRSFRKLTEQMEGVAHLYPDDWPVTPKKKTADA
ncbi:MAG: peptide deformylase [Propionibacteriaceae bacterium]|nr:peptide deformylase [Propionibacteriaceae bacterium]